MKTAFFKGAVLVLLFLTSGCRHSEPLDRIYRYYWGEEEGYRIWIIDGYAVRGKIYNSFLYGGNEQRYPFVPKGEIWIDHAVSVEEFQMTVAHELNERHLMAKFGWTYDMAHDSSLRLEVVMRKNYREICRNHEAGLPKVSPTDRDGTKEIRDIPDSLKLENIYRVPLGKWEGMDVWVVDGYLVRAGIFPDFGFSGNDLEYHFIPTGEIWIDGQISAEETRYSIQTELMERGLMAHGFSYSDAYDSAIDQNTQMRVAMDKIIRALPRYVIPDTLARDAGVIDPGEK
jgi:hypothetical protein